MIAASNICANNFSGFYIKSESKPLFILNDHISSYWIVNRPLIGRFAGKAPLVFFQCLFLFSGGFLKIYQAVLLTPDLGFDTLT